VNTLDLEKLNEFVTDRQPVEVSAGVLDDWFWTAATVYENGEYMQDHRAHTYSSWGTPGFKATMPNGDIVEVVCTKDATEEELANIEEGKKETLANLKELAEKLREKNASFLQPSQNVAETE